MKIAFPDGRGIAMEFMQQSLTYAGVLCGRFSASDHDRRIAEFVEQALERMPWLEPIRVIAPVRKPLPFKANSNAPVAERLPRVTTIALFQSGEPANDPGEMFSWATFVWFQDEFGLPDERAIQSIRQLDWAMIAVDGSY